MSTKEVLRELAVPPENATLAEAIHELKFRQSVERGLAELDRGEEIPIDAVKAKITQWAAR